MKITTELNKKYSFDLGGKLAPKYCPIKPIKLDVNIYKWTAFGKDKSMLMIQQETLIIHYGFIIWN